MALTEKRKAYLRELYRRRLRHNRKIKRENARAWRKRYPEKAKEQDRKKHLRYAERRNVYSKKYYEVHKKQQAFKETRNKRSLVYYYNNPDKARCRRKLSYAVKIGKVIRGDKCFICGSTQNIEGHHEDYTKPYEVKWVCKGCHYSLS